MFSVAVSYFRHHFLPFDGDLTRLGGYSEYDYGWNDKQNHFTSNLSVKGEIGTYYDIMVIGDSFSNHQPWGRLWHNYLKQSTNLSVGVFHINDLDQMLGSNSFKSNPPKILIYESIERHLKSRLSYDDNYSCDVLIITPKPSLSVGNLKAQFDQDEFSRDLSFTLYIGHAIKGVWNELKSISGRKKVFESQLSVAELFSNRLSDKILTINGDMSKKAWSEEIWHGIECGMKQFQNKIQANNKTSVLFLIAPDKLTVYSPYLVNDKWKNISRLTSIYALDDLNIVPLLPALRKSLENYSKDLYLPNDTHWGFSGHKIAGESVVDYIHTNLVK